MLSRTLRLSLAQRMGAIAVTLVVVALAFTPIRFVAAESKDAAASDPDLQRKLEEQRAYEMKMDRAKGKSGTWSEGKSGTWSEGKSRRPAIAYMLKIEGKKGTRGSVDMSDLKAARRLDREDETVVYFRLGDEMWISRDESTIEQVTEALAAEDKLDARQEMLSGRRDAFERERAEIEARREEVEGRKGELELRKERLQVQMERRRANGRPVRDLEDEQASLKAEMDAMWEAQVEMARSHEALHERMQSTYLSDKMLLAEMDKVHQRTLEVIADIARSAIEEGRAERFVP